MSNKNIGELLSDHFKSFEEDVYIKKFEDSLKAYFHVRNAIAVSSGTAAIHLALAAHGVKRGDEVIVPALSVIMSVLPVLYQGAKPVFVDCASDKVDFDYEDMVNKITDRTKAIIPVYLWGCSYNIDRLKRISEKYNIPIIEDACQAHGSKWRNQYLGTIGAVGCFSLKNGKLLSCGEGGFILTNNDSLAEQCQYLRNHSIHITNPQYSFSEIGWNYRITELQACLALENIKSLTKVIEKRKQQTKCIYHQFKKSEKFVPYDYFSEEESNLFSIVLFKKNGTLGLHCAKYLSEKGIVNSTGSFGLISANRRKSIITYCVENNCINSLVTPHSDSFLEKVIAISIFDNTDEESLSRIIKVLDECNLY